MSDILSLAGIVISSIAFFFSMYFIVLANKAAAHVREIENKLQVLAKVEKDIDCLLRDTINTVDIIFADEIYILNNRNELEGEEKNRHKRTIDHILQSRKKLLFFKSLDVNRRKSLIVELYEFGNRNDVHELLELSKRENESTEIKELAYTYAKALESKLDDLKNKMR
ncbi:hypothetical protein [Nitrosomonas sp.]|uniref:hypothetical protein n=1 Tax=Nitrosomonas sp. TaxID=42353 RepID=UPI0025DCC1A5|nr:hypothetical protein [Nitrosomonas sp.]